MKKDCITDELSEGRESLQINISSQMKKTNEITCATIDSTTTKGSDFLLIPKNIKITMKSDDPEITMLKDSCISFENREVTLHKTTHTLLEKSEITVLKTSI